MKYLKHMRVYLMNGFILFACLLSLACKEEKEQLNYFHKVDPVKSVIATLDGSSHAFSSSQTPPYGNEIKLDFPYYFPQDSETPIDLSKVKVTLEFDEEITVLDPIPETVNLTTPYSIRIRNADGAEEQVTLVADVRKSNQAEILTFSLPQIGLNGIIVGSAAFVGIDRQGRDLTNQAPSIKVSAGATISPDPATAQNFNEPVTYTVTAQDGTTKQFVVDDVQKMDVFEIKRGVNVASWLSTPKYDGALRSAFLQERDIKLLSTLGFDHVRLCIDEVVLWDNQGGRIRPYGFDLLHQAIQWCMKYNMRALIDLHITRNHRFTNTENTLFTDPNEPAKYVKLWEDLSDELIQYPNSIVAYELLNEPVSANPENWNRVAALAIQAIRAREPNRTIVVGVCTSAGDVKYDALQLPNNHKILLTFHYYGPYLLTAYGLQSTTGGRRDIPMSYPGQLVPSEWIDQLPANWQSTGQRYYDRATLKTSILKGIDMAKRLNAPVFVGEFGTLSYTPEPSRTNWYRDVVGILNEENIPYTSFDYKGAGYSIVGEDLKILYPNLVDILGN